MRKEIYGGKEVGKKCRECKEEGSVGIWLGREVVR